MTRTTNALIGLPLRLAGWLEGAITSTIWLPMLAFEIPLGIGLLTRGVAAPSAAEARAKSGPPGLSAPGRPD